MRASNKTLLKIAGLILLVILVIIFLVRYATKAHSPEDISFYEGEELKMEVFYNRPSKKGRRIFGDLVPYNEVWRTGANEATTFTTNYDIMVDGSLLKAGKYTLWTVPMEESWKVIFNSKMYPWGIDMEKKAYREAEFDVLVLEVPVKILNEELEQFSIYFEERNDFVFLNIAWDRTKVSLPIKMMKEVSKTLLSPTN
ncbi:DUF2911 domain-containing protein [Gillisia sp. M10.2A]|uniref:DUF2911 domain-containing protein n=1 Tax=Gillisia lutea TaxID=2909668 RepID=A0ABS9EGW5_9FLAO|nr:DUF2911 domain-containing protein [Gillisia lutea]MCF4102096.1 DUF2911 domain-containing protein [Gillisia lutea]